jgi:hypothetical protein
VQQEEKQMIYKIEISIDAGKAFSPVGGLVDKINTGLAEFGVEERMMVRANCISANLEAERELTPREMVIMKDIIERQFAESQPAWNAKVESFRRQSGNVQQSVAQ